MVSIPDVSLSRRHCTLLRNAGVWSVVDTNSSNGTFLNGHRIEQECLSDGDRLRLGDTELLFSAEAAEPPPALETAAHTTRLHINASPYLTGSAEEGLRTRRHRDGLIRLAGLLPRLRSRQELEEAILAAAIEATGASDGAFLQANDGGSQLEATHSVGPETQSTSIDAEIVRLLESGPDGLLRYFHPGETPNCPHESVVAAPLIDGPHCVGAIYVATTRGEPRLDKTDLTSSLP